MKRIITLIFVIVLSSCANLNIAQAMMLKTGISLSDQVPKGFFGSWKITSVMTYSNNPKIFNEVTTDYWNLSKEGDVITLSNPISGAQASVTVEDVQGNRIKFTHITKGKNAKMTEMPDLTLNGENFSGTDKIIIEKYKYGEKISEDIVEYKITAEKMYGNSAQSIFMSGQ